jgi:hypothetical protein
VAASSNEISRFFIGVSECGLSKSLHTAFDAALNTGLCTHSKNVLVILRDFLKTVLSSTLGGRAAPETRFLVQGWPIREQMGDFYFIRRLYE